jgi:hypothetical protein
VITEGQELLIAKLSSTLMILDERPFARANEGGPAALKQAY